MDLEAVQLLNLSPIPELSEIELSTMLDHLSGLSDINGDLTDRNVEELLKEAEDLLDKSGSSKTFESKDLNENPKTEEKPLIVSQVMTDSEEHIPQIPQQSDINQSNHHNVPDKNDLCIPLNTSLDNNTNKHYNSPVDTPSKIYSPGGSCNHIKSTIDSLREFSSIIERTLFNQSKSPSHYNQTVKSNEEELQKKILITNDPLTAKPIYSKQGSHSLKTVKTLESSKKDSPESLNKSVRLLNCFERLYQDRPVRLSTIKTSKSTDKMPKTPLKKKLSKDLKNIKKSSWPVKTASRKMVREDLNANTEVFKKLNDTVLQTSIDEMELIKSANNNFQNSISPNHKMFSLKEKTGNVSEDEFFRSSLNCKLQSASLKLFQSKIDERLILKVLEEVEEIKNQVKKVSAFPEKVSQEELKDKKSPKPEADYLEREKLFSQSAKSTVIKRLEEQFSNLKERYNQQIEKLESENFRLRVALNNQQKIIAPQMSACADNFNSGGTISSDSKNYKTSLFSSPSSAAEKKSESISPENCIAPENTPCLSSENDQPLLTFKEASSQTESELKTACIQCSEECKIGTDILASRKAENKENLTMKKKVIKGKPFSDMNVHQLMKQTKAFDRDTQLLATLRGLQAEVTLKEKENRKLKTEIDSLRRQIKKIVNAKVENSRKSSIGTQTLGLRSFVQKPYNPEIYEVPQEFEKENYELRSRIKALEEEFELLKEKRINDLQSLHQVHEEEMAKLVSKLETQSALTRHLHSLLVNR